MRVRLTETFSILFLFCAFVSLYGSVYAQSGAVNADPDFDSFYSGDGTSGAWKPFKISNPGPAIWKHPTEGWPKGPSLWIYGDSITFDGGVYQVVTVTPGHGYHFEVAWAVVRHGGALRDDVQFVRQIGIDPTGGTNPLSPNVQWSGEYRGTGKFPPELAIDQYARSDHVTIFLRAKNFYTDSRAEVFFDHAILTENGAPPIAVASPTLPPATPTIARQATPTMVRTRVALAATSTLQPTTTATLTSTDTPMPSATRTPRATATPMVAEPESPDLSRLLLALGALACLLVSGGGLLIAAFVFLLRNRSRL